MFFYQAPDLQPCLQKKRSSVPENVDEETLIRMATEAFVRELGLDDDTVLRGKVEIREVAAGTYLMKEESNKVFCLYLFVNYPELSDVLNTFRM